MKTQDRIERLDFLGFDPQVRDALALCTPVIEHALPDALSAFYDVIGATPATRRFFRDDDHMLAARDRQKAHWMSIVSGRYDSAYFESVRKIGLAHSRLGLEPRYYIGGYAHLASALIRAVALPDQAGLARFGGRNSRLLARKLDALVKAIFLDMELAVSLYLEETEANASRERDAIATEFERSVGQVTGSLQTVSETIGTASGKVTRTVEVTLERAVKAASGAENSAQSVRSVAAASEQMQAATGEIAQPSVRNAWLSSCSMVDWVTPRNSSARSFTQSKKSTCDASRVMLAVLSWSSSHVVFRLSHISVVTVARSALAFSRATRKHEKIDDAWSSSNARKRITSPLETSP